MDFSELHKAANRLPGIRGVEVRLRTSVRMLETKLVLSQLMFPGGTSCPLEGAAVKE